MTLRVLLVDDHEVVRVGVKVLIERHPDMEVVGEAGTVREAIDGAESLRPDVMVLDIRLPGGSGVDACREIKNRWPEVKIIMLTSFADDKTIFDAIACGAEGYVLKQIGSAQLIEALEKVGRGQSLLDPAVTSQVLAKVREARQQEQAHAFADLNRQELEILAHVSEGLTNREIGARLVLSEKTVRNYVSTILSKLDLTSRAQAAAYAARNRIEDHL
ncbi:MAG TPA: response regulator transcription factor [Anaerolineae bacterium]|nr:response regulator transcription factor [Anaerolineae bacterium]